VKVNCTYWEPKDSWAKWGEMTCDCFNLGLWLLRSFVTKKNDNIGDRTVPYLVHTKVQLMRYILKQFSKRDHNSTFSHQSPFQLKPQEMSVSQQCLLSKQKHSNCWALKIFSYPGIRLGAAVASWLMRLPLDQAVQFWALAEGIASCSWARHLTLTACLSTQVYKWVLVNLMMRVTLGWTSIPSREE